MRRVLFILALVAGAASGLPVAGTADAQEPPGNGDDGGDEAAAPKEDPVRIDLRVTSSGPGASVSVDRGGTDGLAPGDDVVFRPREGGVLRGVVARVDERAAVVDLVDPSIVPTPGTRGEVRVPASRLKAPVTTPKLPGAKSGEGELPEHTGWSNADEEYEQGAPLLARVRAVRPEDRSKQYGGRLTMLADGTWGDDHSDTILRTGADLWVENPFGSGGSMQMDLAFDQYSFDTPDLDSDDETSFRIERLSYSVGGTRFSPTRIEVGRFLQHGMPQLGLLDGVEYEQRLSNRHRVGASFGFMPTPDVDLESFDDLQIAAFYEWTLDGRADVEVAAGLQKTWHDGKPDRDLIVARADFLPAAGWDLRGAMWVDLYDSGDDDGSGLALTQMHLSTARRWEGDGLDLTYRHVEFPDLLREEYVESIFEDLADSAYDRVSASWFHELSRDSRLRTTGGLWRDEEERGGDFELGLDVTDRWLDGDDAGIAFFGTRGSYSVDAGMRLRWGLADDKGRWDASYLVADRHQDEFSHDSDDLWEHALRGSRSIHLGDGWYASLASEMRTFSEDLDLSLTLYVQKTY